MLNKRILVLMFVVAFLFVGCLQAVTPPITPPTPKGIIGGRIMAPPGPETTKDITGWIPLANATVTITDSEGVTHTVTTDEDGYYTFTDIAVDANTIITATGTVDGNTVIVKDVIPQAVAADEDYEAGIADAESTALALIVEELLEQGVDLGDIDLEGILGSDNFTEVVEQVNSILEGNGNVTTDPGLTNTVGDIAEDIINPPGPSPEPTPWPTSLPAKYYTITATADLGGSISPLGDITVKEGSDKSFTITPDPYFYGIEDVLVDGVSVGMVPLDTFTHIFNNVTTNHTIDAIFVLLGCVYNQDKGTHYNTIQAAITDVETDNTIIVAAGTYDEQVVIDKNLTLQGAGNTTIIQPSGASILTTVKTTPWIGNVEKQMAAIVFVNVAGTQVTIKNLKIDSSLITEVPAGVGGDWVAGLAYIETSGTIENLNVVGNPNLGCRAAGIWASATSVTSSVEVMDCTVIGYNRAGIYAVGGTMIANYHHNEINGPGLSYTGTQVPNGIYFLVDAKGSATYNTITDLGYTLGTWLSTGIGVYEAGLGVLIAYNEIYDVQLGVALAEDSSNTIVEYNDIHNCQTGVKIEGNTIGGGNHIIRYNDIHDNDFAIRCGPKMEDDNVARYNNFVNNPGLEWTLGLGETYIGAVCNIHNTFLLDATDNWWGDATGPGGVGPGAGDTVSANVDFEPWLLSESEF